MTRAAVVPAYGTTGVRKLLSSFRMTQLCDLLHVGQQGDTDSFGHVLKASGAASNHWRCIQPPPRPSFVMNIGPCHAKPLTLATACRAQPGELVRAVAG